MSYLEIILLIEAIVIFALLVLFLIQTIRRRTSRAYRQANAQTAYVPTNTTGAAGNRTMLSGAYYGNYTSGSLANPSAYGYSPYGPQGGQAPWTGAGQQVPYAGAVQYTGYGYAAPYGMPADGRAYNGNPYYGNRTFIAGYPYSARGRGDYIGQENLDITHPYASPVIGKEKTLNRFHRDPLDTGRTDIDLVPRSDSSGEPGLAKEKRWRVDFMDMSSGRHITREFSDELVVGRQMPSPLESGRLYLSMDATVSRSQFALHVTENGIVIENMSKVNITRKNGYPINQPVLLEEGDILELGRMRYMVREICPAA